MVWLVGQTPKWILLAGMPPRHSTKQMGRHVQLILLLVLRSADFGE